MLMWMRPQPGGARNPKMPRFDVLDIVQGHYVSELVWMLHSRAVLAQLASWQTVEQIADPHRWDRNLLRTLLEFLCKTSDLLQKDGKSKYRIARRYKLYSQLGFYLDFYRGAYGNSADHIAAALRQPKKHGGLPDRRFLAQAYDGIGDAAVSTSMLEIIRALNVRHLLDLGCGPAVLLSALAREDTSFIGWGIERSVEMCRIARKNSRMTGIGRRVKIIHGDVTRIARLLSSKQRNQVEALHAGSLLNEFFAAGPRRAVSFIKQLARIFPGRVLLVGDYFSRMNDTRVNTGDFRLTLLHDFAQVISGQGLPPARASEWEEIYEFAGVRLIRGYEGVHRGLAWFHHVVQL
jgi:SAM-dependent methyltransferase